jgi:4-amino-4-deoxy-L-arabinose transferase-like glycosyltransferase
VRQTTSPSKWSAAEVALFLVILAWGAVLRFSALGSGIPYSVGVDEPEIVVRAVSLLRSGDFNPHFFDYPGLYIYAQAAVDAVRFIVGAGHGLWTSLDQAPSSAFYLWGRALTATLGSATVALTYLSARRISVTAAASAAVILASLGLHVRESHWVLTDVPMTFFVTLTLLLTLVAVERGTARAFLWAGAAAGLAAATKYNGGLFLLLPIGALLFGGRRGTSLGLGTGLLATCGGAAAAFFIGAPYTLLDLPGFLNAFGNLTYMYSIGPSPAEPAWLTYLKHLRIALFWPGVATAVLSLGLALFRIVRGPAAERAVWASSLALVLLHFDLIAGRRLVYGRYLLPLLPALAVMMGGTVATVAVAVARRLRWSARATLPATALVLLVATLPAVASVQFVNMLRKTSTHAQAYEWITQQIPKGTKIAIEARGLLLPADDYAAVNLPRLIEHDFEFYQDEGYEYIVASSQSFGPFVYGNPSPDRRAYLALFARLELAATFQPDDDHPGPEYRIYRVLR